MFTPNGDKGCRTNIEFLCESHIQIVIISLGEVHVFFSCGFVIYPTLPTSYKSQLNFYHLGAIILQARNAQPFHDCSMIRCLYYLNPLIKKYINPPHTEHKAAAMGGPPTMRVSSRKRRVRRKKALEQFCSHKTVDNDWILRRKSQTPSSWHNSKYTFFFL